ncbi:MAG: hypothetical protein LBS70_10780 [Candidatus Accumulibacter sp.]|jgi:hypothetical protein|nr:hypothetical protein [Accumulibacter sp.]
MDKILNHGEHGEHGENQYDNTKFIARRGDQRPTNFRFSPWLMLPVIGFPSSILRRAMSHFFALFFSVLSVLSVVNALCG